jgi:hypothetical protein
MILHDQELLSFLICWKSCWHGEVRLKGKKGILKPFNKYYFVNDI